MESPCFGCEHHAPRRDWRQFRGPHGNGAADETDVPTVLNATNSITWKSNLPGRGLSSPIIVGDRVFVTCSSGLNQQRLHVICFNAADGAKLWERQFWATGRTMCHEKTAVAAPTPASDGEHVVAIFSSNDIVCLDLDGNLIWFRGLGRDYPNASNSLGMTSSLLIAGGVVVAQVESQSDAFTAGLELATGVNRWKLARARGPELDVPGAAAIRRRGTRRVAILQRHRRHRARHRQDRVELHEQNFVHAFQQSQRQHAVGAIPRPDGAGVWQRRCRAQTTLAFRSAQSRHAESSRAG